MRMRGVRVTMPVSVVVVPAVGRTVVPLSMLVLMSLWRMSRRQLTVLSLSDHVL